jgi:hypothetical protein
MHHHHDVLKFGSGILCSKSAERVPACDHHNRILLM